MISLFSLISLINITTVYPRFHHFSWQRLLSDSVAGLKLSWGRPEFAMPSFVELAEALDFRKLTLFTSWI